VVERLVSDQLAQRLVKKGGRLVNHTRYYWMMLAEGHLTRVRFSAMLRRLTLLPIPAEPTSTSPPASGGDKVVLPVEKFTANGEQSLNRFVSAKGATALHDHCQD
jgi:hypothetical protein